MGIFSSLNREQKESIGLLQVGTVLEYFDLMLYVHMAVLLNDIFFPKTDAYSASLLAAFAFSSTFVFRPIGALIFGWMGDNIGRKSTIVVTTLIMSTSCILMANLPTYAQIGISATWVMIACRMAQGMSSMGEIVGAQIYVAESVRRPTSYPSVAFITIGASIGTTFALGVGVLVLSFDMNWRIAFWIGAIIAIVGSVARTRLRETPDFLELKRQQMKEIIAELNDEDDSPEQVSQSSPSWKERVRAKTLASYFFVSCGWPLSLYLGYIYFNPILKDDFGYTSAQIIYHNFLLSILFLIPLVTLSVLSYRVHPIKILKIRGFFIALLMLALPFLINNLNSPWHVFLLQTLILILPLDSVPAEAVLIYHLPIYRRFTLASLLFAFSRAGVYLLTSFGLVYLGTFFGAYGLWIITLPTTFMYLYGIRYFENLEHKAGHLTTKPAKSWVYENKRIVGDVS